MIACRLQLNSGRSATYQDDFQHALVSLYGGWLPIRQQKMEKHGEIPSGGRCRICTLSQRMLSIAGYGLIYWGGVALVITRQSTDWAATIASALTERLWTGRRRKRILTPRCFLTITSWSQNVQGIPVAHTQQKKLRQNGLDGSHLNHGHC